MTGYKSLCSFRPGGLVASPSTPASTLRALRATSARQRGSARISSLRGTPPRGHRWHGECRPGARPCGCHRRCHRAKPDRAGRVERDSHSLGRRGPGAAAALRQPTRPAVRAPGAWRRCLRRSRPGHRAGRQQRRCRQRATKHAELVLSGRRREQRRVAQLGLAVPESRHGAGDSGAALQCDRAVRQAAGRGRERRDAVGHESIPGHGVPLLSRRATEREPVGEQSERFHQARRQSASHGGECWVGRCAETRRSSLAP